MKILVVSHFYPPLRDGGYAQLCAEVSAGLAALGQKISVLTSNYGASLPGAQEPGIFRLLRLENDLLHYSPQHFFTHWLLEERLNDRTIKSVIGEVKPDLVFVWGMYGLSKSVPAAIEALIPGKVVYFISDHWPADFSLNQAYWLRRNGSGKRRYLINLLAPLAKGIMALRSYPPVLRFEHAIIVSNAVRRNLITAGLPFEDSIVIHSGSDAQEFYHQRSYREFDNQTSPLRIVYAGNLGHHKGVHTAVEAMALLHKDLCGNSVSLTIFGSGHPEYEGYLRELIQKKQLHDSVKLVGRISRGEMSATLQQYDVLLVPSICEDALPRIVQEGMLGGLIVVASDRGGTPEMVIECETGLLFQAENSRELASSLEYIVANRSSSINIAKEGQKKALAEFTLEVMINRIYDYLQKVFYAG